MHSTILRRVAGARTIARPLVQSPQAGLHVRSYATTQSSEEVDPQLNGYPQLPFVSRQYLPAKGWQDQLLRRNFGDTVSLDFPTHSTLTSIFLHYNSSMNKMNFCPCGVPTSHPLLLISHFYNSLSHPLDSSDLASSSSTFFCQIFPLSVANILSPDWWRSLEG
jgi:hypothetical protein